MKALMLALMTWASANTELDVPDIQPIVKRADAETLWSMMYPGEPYEAEQNHQIMALYGNDFIYLRDDWSVTDLRDVSTLLHELIHHMQAYSDNEYACVGKKEEEAYESQIEFLEAAGVEDPLELLEINGLFLAMVTQCGPAWAR